MLQAVQRSGGAHWLILHPYAPSVGKPGLGRHLADEHERKQLLLSTQLPSPLVRDNTIREWVGLHLACEWVGCILALDVPLILWVGCRPVPLLMPCDDSSSVMCVR